MPPPPAHLWGITAPLTPLTGGHRNQAFRTTGLTPDLVFKSSRRTGAQIDWLLPVFTLARQAGFAVPHLHPSLEGKLLDHGWTCETFLPGRPFTPADLPTIAPQIARFHSLTANLPQRPGFLSSQDLLTQTTGGDVDLTAMPPTLAATCRAAWHAVPDQMTVIHGDLNPGNLLHLPDGQPALIDWDECRRDLALFDLAQLRPSTHSEYRATLAWEVACSWQIEPDHARKIAVALY